LQKNPRDRLGSRGGAEEVKAHPFFRGVNWHKVMTKQTKPPDPYLAEYAKSIIQTSPYMAAGHPQTTGRPIGRDHPNYVHGWSFAETKNNGDGMKNH